MEVFHNGWDALQTFTPGRFDVALIYLAIPTVPGDRIARHMRERDPALVTVLVTGWVYDDDDSRLLEFDLRLQKPVLGPDLEETVAKAMELHDSRESAVIARA